MEDEVIFFKIPTEECVLFVENLHTNLKTEQLYEIFGEFGLLYDITVFQYEGKQSNFAFVKFYSRRAALDAKRALHGAKINDLMLKVTFSKPRDKRGTVILDINRCIELANYYIGFDQWSTNIVSIGQESLEYDESAALFRCTYQCKIRFTLKDSRYLEVTGKATGGARDRAVVLEFAKKNAITDARKSIFQRLALIVLGEGKVAVHFLDAPLEEWEDEKPQEPPVNPFLEGIEDRLIIDL